MLAIYMEFLVLLAAVSLTICYAFYSRKHKLPPSPGIAIPILGHLHLLGKSPHSSLLQLSRKCGDFMFLKLGSINTIVVSSSTSAREVLKVHDHVFASRPYVTQATHFAYQPHGMVWAGYGDHWKNLRRICNFELFTAKQVHLFSDTRRMEVMNFLSNIANSAGEKIDLTQKLSDLTFNFVMRICFSKSLSTVTDEHEKERALSFKKCFIEALSLGAKVFVGDVIPYLKWIDRPAIKELDALYAKTDGFMQRELEEHENNHGRTSKDFMDIMLSLARDGALSRLAIKGTAFDMLVAGTDTTAILVEWAMAELIRNPTLLEKAQKELEEVTGRQRHLEEEDIPKLKYLQAIVKETLRLHPPTPLMLPHESTEDCKVLDYVIPAKTRLIVNVYAIGRDPLVWKQPLKFDPERFLNSAIDVRGQNYELLPFGSGRRICPGVQLALVEAHYALGSLLNVFDWSLPDGLRAKDVDMTEGVGLVLPKASHLELVPQVNKCFVNNLM